MDTLPLPQLVARMDADRLRRYREHLDFYHGRQWTGTARRRERRLTFNYARAVVDKAASYLKTGLDFAVDPVADTPSAGSEGGSPQTYEEAWGLATRTEAVLRRVWEENNLDQLETQYRHRRLRPPAGCSR